MRWLFQQKAIKPIIRPFRPAYIRDTAVQKKIEHEGFAVLKQAVTEDELNAIQTDYNVISKDSEFIIGSKFESSGNFKSRRLQQEIFELVARHTERIAGRFAYTTQLDIGEGGAFFVKPSHPESILHPHQDSTVIDETKYYGLFVWIPLQDVTIDCGPLVVLPKSHRWGNSYRSQHIPWAFRKLIPELWKYMIPVTVNRGDLILFDTAIIHGSMENRSGAQRVVMCGALLPQQHQKVDYCRKYGSIYEYSIPIEYWLDGGTASQLQKYPNRQVSDPFPATVSKFQLNSLLTYD